MILLNKLSSRHKACTFAFMGLAWLLLLLFSMRVLAQEDWIHQVRTAVEQHQIPAALAIVDHRLAEAPPDMDAHAWRGRLLAWTGRWQEAEIEYHLVLDTFPNDEDVLIGLADVLLWQQKYGQALAALEMARSADLQNPEILLRRARVLSLLQRIPEARAQFQALLTHDPANRSALSGLADLTVAPRYELRIAEEADFSSYTENAQVETVTLTAHWNKPWTTGFGISPYHLFGESAVKIWSDACYTFHKNNWVRVLGAGANPQDVVPEREVLIEYGHGFRFSNEGIKGLESSYQEHSLWYRGGASRRPQRNPDLLPAQGVDVDTVSYGSSYPVHRGRSGLGSFGFGKTWIPAIPKTFRERPVCCGCREFCPGRSNRPPVGSHLWRRLALSLRRGSGRNRLCRQTRSRTRPDPDQPWIELWHPILAGLRI